MISEQTWWTSSIMFVCLRFHVHLIPASHAPKIQSVVIHLVGDWLHIAVFNVSFFNLFVLNVTVIFYWITDPILWWCRFHDIAISGFTLPKRQSSQVTVLQRITKSPQDNAKGMDGSIEHIWLLFAPVKNK